MCFFYISIFLLINMKCNISIKIVLCSLTGVAIPSGGHEQGTLRGPQTNCIIFVGPMDIVHPVHPLATPLC